MGIFFKFGQVIPEIPSSGATLNSHTFSMETHCLVSITAMSQGVCVIDWRMLQSKPQSYTQVKFSFSVLYATH